MTPESEPAAKLELILRDVLSEIFQGRSFHHDGAILSPQRAFAGDGFLPLFAARAAKRFKTLHGSGIKLNRCLSCGLDRPQESGCNQPCPMKQGIRVLNFPFSFALSSDGLLGTTVKLSPYRPALMVALFMIQDVAIEVLQMSKDPRMIAVTSLINDLALEISPLIQAAQQQISAPPNPEPEVPQAARLLPQPSATKPPPIPTASGPKAPSPAPSVPAQPPPRPEPKPERSDLDFNLSLEPETGLDPLIPDFEALIQGLDPSPR